MLKDIITSMRPGQWVKNIVIFAALVFSLNVSDRESLLRSLAAFALFCLLSSAVYLLNDVMDQKRDAAHPLKRNRPLASGRLSPKPAIVAAALLGGGSIVIAFILSPAFGLAALSYVMLMLFYTFWLKNIVIADVFAIAAGFVIRAVAGAEAIGVPISDWLLVCVIMLALFLALCKRRQEISYLDDSARPVLGQYSKNLLDQMVAMAGSGAAICYSLYTLWPETVHKLGTADMKYTIPLVIFGLFRYLFLVYKRQEAERPERALFTDPWILGDILLYGLLVWYLIYK
jgi:4-hydroxybenzoate polyprenyltransferase